MRVPGSVRSWSFLLLLMAPLDMSAQQPVYLAEDDGVVERSGLRLHWVAEGRGEPAVVLGPAGYYRRMFTPVIRDHLRLIFLENRAWISGDTLAELASYTMDLLMEDIEASRQALRLDRFVLIGHSFTTLVALEYAKRYPNRVSHLVLTAMAPRWGPTTFNASAQFWNDSASDSRKARLEENRRMLPDSVLRGLAAGPAFVRSYARSGPRLWYDENFDSTPLWKDVEINTRFLYHFLGTALTNYSAEEGLDGLDMPVLLVLGRYDFPSPYFLWAPIRDRFPSLTHHLFERSGHHPMFEEPDVFAEVLIGWVRNH